MLFRSEALGEKWEHVRKVRRLITEKIEPYRKNKIIGSSNEAVVTLELADGVEWLALQGVDMAEMAIVSKVEVLDSESGADYIVLDELKPRTAVRAADDPKCERCWRHLPDVAAATGLCGRCDAVVTA